MTVIKIYGDTFPRKAFLIERGYKWDAALKGWIKTVAATPSTPEEIKAAGANVKGCVAMVSADMNSWTEIWRSKTYAAPVAPRIGSGRDEYGTSFGDHDYV